MKNHIIKIQSFLFKNIKVLIIAILVIIFIFDYVKSKVELNELLMKNDVKGTYALQDVDMPTSNNEYFVLVDGQFYRYKQFELLDEGTYKNDYEDIYILKSNNIDQNIVCSNGKIYFYDSQNNEILIYYKFSDLPTFINVDVESNVKLD